MPPKIIWGKFQSTLPRGERQGAGNTGEYYIKISIHAPARGATESRVILQQGYTVFQSTLPRGERRVADSNKVEVKQISIHAPARGATKNYLVTVNRFYISIHAPARGATFVEKRAAYVEIFQSTLPRGERLQCLHQNHLPFLFQSTLPRGERLDFDANDAYLLEFQSTLPRGERLRRPLSYPVIVFYFNPRSREGSDRRPCPIGI